MGRNLENFINKTAPDSDYPDGRIRDKTASLPGTSVNEAVYGDIHQLVAKMYREAGITPNGMPDNDYVGYQHFDALLEVTKAYRGIKGLGGNETLDATMLNVACVNFGAFTNITLADVGRNGSFFEVANISNSKVTLTAPGPVQNIQGSGNAIDVYPGQTMKLVILRNGGFLTWVPFTNINVRTITVLTGDWDMSSTLFINVAHGLTATKIIGVTCKINNDANTVFYDLTAADPAGGFSPQGAISWNSTNIILNRLPSGLFDSTDYNSTSFNRGIIKIDYTP